MTWNDLRAKVRDSILAGVGDALVEIEGNGDTGNALGLLPAKMASALPAPVAPRPEMPAAAAEPTSSLPATRNGRKRATAAE
jgi:hypothetical protein